LISAAVCLPEIPFYFAGDFSQMPQLLDSKPKNVNFVGLLTVEEIAEFYRKARLLVVPSVWMETFGAVAGEAMSHGLPVIASKRGALEEVVDNCVTGFHFEPGNVNELVEKIRLVFTNPGLCQTLGRAGREKAEREYCEDVFFIRFKAVLDRALEISE
jgi:glycosyltransferase involved in cell wall biosynthesis